MRIALISKGKSIFEINELSCALRNRGHDVLVIDPVISVQDLHTESFWKPYDGLDILY
jgi:hypothetical protein